MGRKRYPSYAGQPQYAMERLRSMLEGWHWASFKRKQPAPNGSKKRKARYLFIDGVWFTAFEDQGLGPASLKVKAQGQMVVLRFITKEQVTRLHNEGWGRWLDEQLGPVVAKTDSP